MSDTVERGRRTWGLGVAALVAVALAGCGGSSTPGPSRGEFAATADRVCREGMATGRAKIPVDGSPIEQTQALAAAIARIGVSLSRVDVPDAQRAALTRVVAAYAGFAAGERLAAQALTTQDAATLHRALAEIKTAVTVLRRDTVALGIGDCAPKTAGSNTTSS